MTDRRIRVLVADDSETVRAAIRALFAEDPALDVVGEAADGVEAVDRAVALRPDVITMDILMPRLDGLGAIAAIMAQSPTRILVVCDTTEQRQTEGAFRAIEMGALELIPKPSLGRPAELRAWGRRLAEAVRLMADVPVVHRRRLSSPPPMPSMAAGQAVDAFGIVASTGGPPALALLVESLADDDVVPLLVAQHMAEGFTSGLVRWLSTVTRLRVVVAKDGARCERGHVYLPPDGHDLEVGRGGSLVVSPPSGVHCPSGDRLLASIARVYGSRAGGAVLTGMGDDGAQGLLEIRRAGGFTMAQDRSSSVVFGMPQVAAAVGATENLLPLDAIASLVRKVSKGGSRTIRTPVPPRNDEQG